MVKTNVRPPTVTRTTTHEGAPAWHVGALDELLLTAITTFSGENTFYETADQRMDRLRSLVQAGVVRDHAAVARLIADLRSRYFIRTASAALACEYVRTGAPRGRQVVSDACQRPDEPAEVIAYWLTNYGRSLPQALRKGVADAAVRLYNERAWLKYGQNDRAAVSMADVIELCHPKPSAQWQSALFRYILDQTHHGDGKPDLDLQVIANARHIGQIAPEQRRLWVQRTPELLRNAGYTWEKLSGWLPGGMAAEAWEAVIPQMGVMALLRNLRNFDAAGISRTAQATVEAALTDGKAVSRSRIFPYRVWQAYKAAPSDRWKHPLATTLELATANVPSFNRTLFLVDVSGSMADKVSGRSDIRRYEVACLMGATAYMQATDSTLALFAVNSCGFEPVRGASTMNFVSETVQAVERHISGFMSGDIWGRYNFSHTWEQGPLSGLGQGTNLHAALRNQFDPAKHDRAVVFTDDQSHDRADLSAHIPEITYFNLGGYAPQSDWGKRRFHFGGFSDAALVAVHDLA